MKIDTKKLSQGSVCGARRDKSSNFRGQVIELYANKFNSEIQKCLSGLKQNHRKPTLYHFRIN